MQAAWRCCKSTSTAAVRRFAASVAARLVYAHPVGTHAAPVMRSTFKLLRFCTTIVMHYHVEARAGLRLSPKQSWLACAASAPDCSARTDACEWMQTAAVLPQQLAAWRAIAWRGPAAMHDCGKAASCNAAQSPRVVLTHATSCTS